MNKILIADDEDDDDDSVVFVWLITGRGKKKKKKQFWVRVTRVKKNTDKERKKEIPIYFDVLYIYIL